MLERDKSYIVTDLWFSDKECAIISDALPVIKPGTIIKVISLDDSIADVIQIGDKVYTQADLDKGFEGRPGLEGFLSHGDVSLGRIKLIHSVGDPHPYVSTATVNVVPSEIQYYVPPIFNEIAENTKEIIKLLKDKRNE